MRRSLAVALLVRLWLPSAVARAEPKAPTLEPTLELPLLGAGAAVVIGSEAAKSWFVPATCRWCEQDASGQVDVNGFDKSIRSALVGRGLTAPTWSKVSDVTVFGLLPLTAVALDWSLAHDERFDRPFGDDLGIMAESVLASALVDQLVKFVALRQRPYAAYDAPYTADYHASVGALDDNLSFFSGHSAAALSVTVAASRLIELRTGRKLGYAILVPLGILASFMRVAADKHWATDVLTGMVVGAVAGWVVPSLHAGS